MDVFCDELFHEHFLVAYNVEAGSETFNCLCRSYIRTYLLTCDVVNIHGSIGISLSNDVLYTALTLAEEFYFAYCKVFAYKHESLIGSSVGKISNISGDERHLECSGLFEMYGAMLSAVTFSFFKSGKNVLTPTCFEKLKFQGSPSIGYGISYCEFVANLRSCCLEIGNGNFNGVSPPVKSLIACP